MAKVDLAAIAARFDGTEVQETELGPIVIVPRESFRAICEALKLEGCELSSITAVDKRENVELVVHLLESPSSQITVKAVLPDGDLKVDSLYPVWEGAEWQEREVYDMFGVEFVDHPDLTRVLIVDDFEGFPLRKSFELEEAEW